MERLKIVGVMGSGQRGYEDLSLVLGEMLARMGVHLLTGGGSGVMDTVSKGFQSVPQPPRSLLPRGRSVRSAYPGALFRFRTGPALTPKIDRIIFQLIFENEN